MDTFAFDRLARSLSTPRSRRGALRALLGAGALGAIPALAVRDDAVAFRSLSGCKQHCERFEGDCRNDCNECCNRTISGNQKRCNFGCGTIRTKRKRKKM